MSKTKSGSCPIMDLSDKPVTLAACKILNQAIKNRIGLMIRENYYDNQYSSHFTIDLKNKYLGLENFKESLLDCSTKLRLFFEDILTNS